MSTTITIVRNLTKDPELVYTPSGVAKMELCTAVNRRWQSSRSSKWEELVSFFDTVRWREIAENLPGSCSKGRRVLITGRLDVRDLKRGDGSRKTKVEIVLEEIGPSLRFATAQITKIQTAKSATGDNGISMAPRRLRLKSEGNH